MHGLQKVAIYNHESKGNKTFIILNLLLLLSMFPGLSVFQHHCRKCGSVVCGACSAKKFMLPSQSSKPLRVCDNCYNDLAKVKNQVDSQSTPGEHLINLIDMLYSSFHVEQKQQSIRKRV